MNIGGFEFPENLYYDSDHWWIRPEGDQLVLGMDDFAQKLAGEIVFVQLPTAGKKLKKGKKLSKVESGKWLGKIICPVDGKLIDVNQNLEAIPTLINQDCYGDGWMFRIKANEISQLDELIHGAQAIEVWAREEIAKHVQSS